MADSKVLLGVCVVIKAWGWGALAKGTPVTILNADYILGIAYQIPWERPHLN